ncbi:uncharacterized protein LOC108737200 [Agrilus planipennis]|uniref:Uncharacterized protein LOC108737200 n=1 Tax=Agrilus planipennis TaxID=224129 RepID=A0A1W4WZ47_AGRPL|nr:uncharacterized protein LOC108737200 [Agrilus planipennis]
MERKRRPNKIVYANGNAFHTRRISARANTRYLRCTFYNKTGCKASAKMPLNDTNGEIILMYDKHNHNLDLKSEFKRALRAEVCKGFGSYKDIYEDVSLRFPGAAQLCPYESIKTALYRWKQISLMKKGPNNKNTTVIPENSAKPTKASFSDKINLEIAEMCSDTWNEDNIAALSISELTNLCESTSLDYSIADLTDNTIPSQTEVVDQSVNSKKRDIALITDENQNIQDLLATTDDLKKQIEDLRDNIITLTNQIAEERSERLILQNTIEKFVGGVGDDIRDDILAADIFFQ